MQSGTVRTDRTTQPFERGAITKVRPSLFPESERTARGDRAQKIRPLDHLSFHERRAVSYLSKGGFWPGIAREIAEGQRDGKAWMSRWSRREEYAYQLWLFDHQ